MSLVPVLFRVKSYTCHTSRPDTHDELGRGTAVVIARHGLGAAVGGSVGAGVAGVTPGITLARFQ